MTKHLDPIVKRTKTEMQAGARAAKKSARQFKMWMAAFKKAEQKENLDNAPAAFADYKAGTWVSLPIDDTVSLPQAVKDQIAVANSFYEKGKFYPLIEKIQALVKEIKARGPAFRRIATVAEKKSLLEAYADLTKQIAAIRMP